MDDLAIRYRAMLAELSQRGVRLVYRESINSRYVSITTGSGVSVLTVSRKVAIEAGISPHSLSPKPGPARQPRATDARRERYTSHQEMCMPSIEPVQWQPPHEAVAALKPLLARNKVVENIIVRLSRDKRFPIRGARYRVARFALIGEVPFWIDAVSQRPLYSVTGFRLAELAE
ncbi:hypothetical protein [Burkholderia pseudomallei]|uniref:hypothetical protein n=1 Tax=Burkholderia pseudomallei TaxID=28450 RepID=UPI00050EED0C|nr:hypothetical protein [Burkholderia pseudomallei]KGC58669.1 hypothetical protein DP56_1348 [Burkholderia pseudomallei]